MSKGASDLRSWRDKQKPPMKQRTLAAMLDIDASILSKIENGRWKPGRALSLKIHAITKIKPGDWDLDAPAPSRAA